MSAVSTDPRVARSRAAVLVAARDLVIETGFDGFTIEGVSARSGVAKTTIYRQWPDRNHLLLDVFEENVIEAMPPKTDDLHADLLVSVSHLAAKLEDPTTSGLIPALIEAAERDEVFRAVSRPFVERRRLPVINRLQQAVADGKLPPDADLDLICALLVGPLFYRRLLTRQRGADERMLSALVRTVIDGACS
jgi:AcrR family transcriptional regulator